MEHKEAKRATPRRRVYIPQSVEDEFKEINDEFGITFESMEREYAEWLGDLSFSMRTRLARKLNSGIGAVNLDVPQLNPPLHSEGPYPAMPSSSPFPAPSGSFKEKK